jgi:Methyltransferase domain
LLEIGIGGGGSMDMWRHYLGSRCELYGVDTDPECLKFDDLTVFIGDQADRSFWARFRDVTPHFDIIIDDGGHTPEQQRVTLEELLPRLRQGGVYICEDVHGDRNAFLGYIYGLFRELFAFDLEWNEGDNERQHVSTATPLQSSISSIHLYPYVVVIERAEAPPTEFVAAKHGTEWPQW